MTQHVMYHKFLSVPALVRGPQSHLQSPIRQFYWSPSYETQSQWAYNAFITYFPKCTLLPWVPLSSEFPESLWMAPPICPNQSHKWLPSWPHWLTRSFWFYVLNVYIQPPLSISLSNVIQVTLMWAPFQQLPTRCPICSYQLSNQFCG